MDKNTNFPENIMINQDSEDIAILYELAMAIGKSLDLKENCREFCKILTRRKGFSYVGIWLWEKNFTIKNNQKIKKAVLVFSVPAFKSIESSISSDHSMFKNAHNKKLLYQPVDSHNLKNFLLETKSGTGTMAIFPLRNFGAIQLLSPVWGSKIPQKEINQLSHILKRFALSIKACLDHNQASKLLEISKMESIGTLAGGIAHDFNNILTPILGFISLSLSEIKSTDNPAQSLEKIENYIKLIQKSSFRAAKLVKQILNYCKKRDEKIETLDICEIITDSMELLKATTPPSIKIVFKNHNPLIIRIARSHLYQIIMNICSNAIKAVGNSGKITITAEIDNFNSLVSNITNNFEIASGKYALIKIADTGHGIPQELIKRIFDPFFTTNEIGSGTGLGLATAYNLSKYYHGTVKVSNTGPGGTIFSIYLPCCSDQKLCFETLKNLQNKKQIPQETLPEIELKNIKLLFIDDEKMLLNAANSTFTKMNIDFQIAGSGKEGLKIFKANPDHFNAIVTDYLMDDINGDELAKQVNSINSDIPIIITTGFSENFTEKDALKAGAVKLIEKPYDFFDLIKTICNLIKKGPEK